MGRAEPQCIEGGRVARRTFASCFRNIDPPHRRRKVAPRGHAIPELVEVARKVGLERRIDCPSTPAAPWFTFTRLKASQISRLGILNGFASSTGLYEDAAVKGIFRWCFAIDSSGLRILARGQAPQAAKRCA